MDNTDYHYLSLHVHFNVNCFVDLLMSGLFVLGRKASGGDVTDWRTTCRPQITDAIVTPATVLANVNHAVMARSKCDCKISGMHSNLC